ncbi:MAG: zinc ABC transporter substrate-binding protein [Proteobacteria bacterium]|nr:zinc ABC transporter substrate-binding protein [Pseudomonadota bacterium]MBU2226947.1 zinc ABC transporter substrate-binding protein [Pseudomonadota bacterium]MBU2260497.1 zinc ABC transporter substrate-binding protein [Pseudomonadota bacterium]
MRKAFFLTVLGLLIISGIALQAFAFAETIRVSVSILPQAYFVERVAGGRAAIRVMIPKGASPETYEPTPQQLVALSDSALYVKVGAPGLPFEEKYLRTLSARARKMTVVNMSEGVAFRKEDPHVWVSPAAVRTAAGNICRALTLHDPSGSDEYRRNLTVFLKDIDALEDEIRRALAGKKGYSFMVYHPAWGYFADEYGLRQLAVEEEGKPVSAAHIRKMIDMAREKGIRAVLVQKGFDAKSARAIARDIGGEVVETDPLERDWPAGMRNFTAILEKVLRK